MLRAILAVIVGYLVMGLFVFVTFTALYAALGTEGSFREGSYDISATWAVASLVLGFVAAVLGGFTCRAIAKRPGPGAWLAGVVLVLGLGQAILVLGSERPDPGPRGGEVSSLEAMAKAVSPTWFLIVNPLLAAVGVALGARRKRSVQG